MSERPTPQETLDSIDDVLDEPEFVEWHGSHDSSDVRFDLDDPIETVDGVPLTADRSAPVTGELNTRGRWIDSSRFHTIDSLRQLLPRYMEATYPDISQRWLINAGARLRNGLAVSCPACENPISGVTVENRLVEDSIDWIYNRRPITSVRTRVRAEPCGCQVESALS